MKKDHIVPTPLTVRGNPRTPSFGDYSKGETYQTIQDKQLLASAYFDSLPQDIRGLFGSSAQFFDSLNDPNVAELLAHRGITPTPLKSKKTQKNQISAPSDTAAPATPVSE